MFTVHAPMVGQFLMKILTLAFDFLTPISLERTIFQQFYDDYYLLSLKLVRPSIV